MRSKYTRQVIKEQIRNFHPDAMVYLYETCFVTVNNILESERVSKTMIPQLLRSFVIETWFDIHRNPGIEDHDPELMIETKARGYVSSLSSKTEEEMPVELGEALRPFFNLMPEADRELLYLCFAENLNNKAIHKLNEMPENEIDSNLVISLQKLLDSFHALQGHPAISVQSGTENYPEIIRFLRNPHSYDEWFDLVRRTGLESEKYADQILNAVVAVIKERKAELDHYIRTHSKIKLIGNNWGSSFTWISGTIIIIAILGYFLTAGNKVNDQPVSMVQRIADKLKEGGQVFRKKKDEFDLYEPGQVIAESRQEEDKTEQQKTAAVSEEVNPSVDETETEIDTTEATERDDLVIKKDVLLKIITVKVIEKKSISDSLSGLKTDSDLTASTSEKLNPEAKLPEKEKPASQFIIELWKSPVNYKGYRGFKNRMIIFGMDEAEWIRIFKLDEQYYLGYEPGVFYKLDLVNEFRPLSKLRDQELIKSLSL